MTKYLVGYWSINGVPACRSKEASHCGVDFECSCTPQRFKEQSAVLLQEFPDSKVEHHIGESCPIYVKEHSDFLDYCDALEEKTLQKFSE